MMYLPIQWKMRLGQNPQLPLQLRLRVRMIQRSFQLLVTELTLRTLLMRRLKLLMSMQPSLIQM